MVIIAALAWQGAQQRRYRKAATDLATARSASALFVQILRPN
jgi:hypothetical protein